MNVFSPDRDDLFVVGLIQPDSGIFGLMHWQAAAVARFLRARRDGRPSAAWFRGERTRADRGFSGGIRYAESQRHDIEVEHWSYRKSLQRLVKRLSV